MNKHEIENKIKEANVSYRNGESILSDQQYDILLDELKKLDPNSKLLNEVGGETIEPSRKSKLPISMFSMNKVKSVDELKKWFKSKNISEQIELVLTPKFDGASLVVVESDKKAWTRGNGIEGQESDEHLEKMNTNNIDDDVITFGEAIMKRDVFDNNDYSSTFSNPRNLVSGKLNDKTPTDILKDIDYIRYGLVGKDFQTKSDLLYYLNERQKHKVQYKISFLEDLTEENLSELYLEWSKVYEIDGIIIEVNLQSIRDSLGRERNNNPCYARAYKGEFTEVKETTIENITWDISKQGLIKPVMNVKSINLDGVNVTNVTGNNAKFMKVNELGIGSVIKVTRSGGVIPKLVDVVKSTGFKLPNIGVEIGWNDNNVELITLEETDDQKLKQLISFFRIMEVDNLGEGVVKQFFENGFDTVKKILSMKKEDMIKLDKFGVRKSQKIVDSINEKRTMTISKLQHASGLFKNLGSKKLLLLEHLYESNNVSVENITSVEGFSDISAKSYLDSIDVFKSFVNDLGSLLTINKTGVKEVSTDGGLNGQTYLFTGVRRKDLEELLTDKSANVSKSMSKKVTHLVCKDKSSKSSKMLKAIENGCVIMDVNDLEQMLSVV